jgi:tRNA A64-2'-O-ribosylphosphate transferase
MPDALSKTLPIWCAVINRAIAKRRSNTSTNPSEDDDPWNSNLYCPPNVVSGTEKSQIEGRIDKWADQLLVSPPTSNHIRS